MLPPEVIEHILWYVDYKTLKIAAEVHPVWKEVVLHVARVNYCI